MVHNGHGSVRHIDRSSHSVRHIDRWAVIHWYKDFHVLIGRLGRDSLLDIEWFDSNAMKLIQHKYHPIISPYKYENMWARIVEVKTYENLKQSFEGVVTEI